MLSIHERARQLVAQSHGERTLSEAYQELSRRAANVRKYGRKRINRADRHAFHNVESPQVYWWQKDDQ